MAQSLAQQRLESAAHLAAILTEEASIAHAGAHARNGNAHIVARDVVELMRIARRVEGREASDLLSAGALVATIIAIGIWADYFAGLVRF